MIIVLLFLGIWAFTFIFWIMKVVEVAGLPAEQFRAARTEKVTWVLVVVLFGIFGAVIWQLAKRQSVLAASGNLLPPAGWYPDPNAALNAGAMRWWDGTRWTESGAPPLP